ncbi:hypothetical protein O3P69_003786 [Scylla paramamosain]|uniref:Uncharacterized protein n=1 Tax=Scylla paramamosain TaxID=85552 RepID=A0AAW0UD91_SCYPA
MELAAVLVVGVEAPHCPRCPFCQLPSCCAFFRAPRTAHAASYLSSPLLLWSFRFWVTYCLLPFRFYCDSTEISSGLSWLRPLYSLPPPRRHLTICVAFSGRPAPRLASTSGFLLPHCLFLTVLYILSAFVDFAHPVGASACPTRHFLRHVQHDFLVKPFHSTPSLLSDSCLLCSSPAIFPGQPSQSPA